MRIVPRLLVLLPLLWLVLCASAHGAKQVDQITLVQAGSDDAVDALRDSDPNTLRARSGDTLVLRLAVSGPYEITQEGRCHRQLHGQESRHHGGQPAEDSRAICRADAGRSERFLGD